MKFRFSKLPRHAQFNYKPRFYNEDQERQEELRNRHLHQGTEAQMKQRISQGFQRAGSTKFQFRTVRSQQNSASNYRLLGIIVFFFAVAYFLLTSNIEGIIAALDS